MLLLWIRLACWQWGCRGRGGAPGSGLQGQGWRTGVWAAGAGVAHQGLGCWGRGGALGSGLDQGQGQGVGVGWGPRGAMGLRGGGRKDRGARAGRRGGRRASTGM